MYKILVIEEDPQLREEIISDIKQAGFKKVYEAANGLDALLSVEKHNPDVVILNISIPVVGGILALKKIKVTHPNAIIIMCSTADSKEFFKMPFVRGESDLLLKPFSREKLIGIIKAIE